MLGPQYSQDYVRKQPASKSMEIVSNMHELSWAQRRTAHARANQAFQWLHTCFGVAAAAPMDRSLLCC